jgi:glycosyltransferase involved in cell wall biosynthesis
MHLTSERLRIFIIHAHNLTNHNANGDGLVAWAFINELARRGHRIHAVTDKLDVCGEIPSNLTLIEIPRRSKNKLKHYLTYMAKVRTLYDRVAATEGVDIAHQMNPVVRGLSLALLGKNVPILLGTYVGDWKPLRKARKLQPPPLTKRLTDAFKTSIDALQQYHASEFALATPHALSRLPFSFCQTDRIWFLHHGVDTVLFHPEPKKGDPAPHSLSILFLGSLHKHKGTLTLIDAFRVIAAEIPEAQLIFAGSGPIDEIRCRLEEYGLGDRTKFLGPLSRSEVAGWLRACTVLCAPSFGEPYGQNILEAMATGKPVVATSEGGHRYLLDALGSRLVTPGDATALAAALLAVLHDPISAKQMGYHNRLLVEERNALPRVTNALEQIYRNAILQYSSVS